MNPDDVLNPTCIIGGPVVCAAKNGVDGAVSSAASNGFKQAAETMFAAYDDIFKQFMTSWVNSGFLVSLDNKATQWFQDSTLPITIFLLVVGLMVAGARVMYSHRGEPFQEVMQALGRAVAVITLGTAAIQIFVWGGDSYAQWILKVSGTTATAGIADTAFAASSPGLALIFGLMGVLAVAFQWVIMFVRQALMILLNALWQLAAASALLRRGEQAFEKVTAWIIAFILYMPVAASIYAFAWRLKNGQDGVGGVIYGLMLIVLAVIALPAIMRLLMPATAALGNAVGGAIAMGVAAAALQAGVAVGAAVATGGGSAAAGAGTAASTSSSAGVAEGGEVASAGGGPGGGYGDDASPIAGGEDGDVTAGGGSDGASGIGGGDGASGAEGSVGASGGTGDSGVASGSDADSGSGSGSGSGQSAASRASWAMAAEGANHASEGTGTAEGMIGE